MSKRRPNPDHRHVHPFRGLNSTKSKSNFWVQNPEISSGCGKEVNGGVLALELSLQESRLEPINGRHSPVRSRHLEDGNVGSPSTHWRGLCAGLPTVYTPVHHLFSLPSVSPADGCETSVTEDPSPGSKEHPIRPASCPSSRSSSVRELSENASYTDFRKSLTAVKSSLHLSQMTRVPLWEYVGTGGPCGHPIRDIVPSSLNPSSWTQTKNDKESSIRPKTVDISYGAQGFVSRLCGQLHGHGTNLWSLPVQDLTSKVPIRKGQGYQASHGCMKVPNLGAAPSGHDTDLRQCCMLPARLTPGTQANAMVEKSPLESLMTAVYEVAEVLHVLSKYRPDLSRPLFERLITWSSDVAESVCFVADVDFSVPKGLVDKAHDILSQIRQRSSKNRTASPTCSPRPAPGKAKRENGARCATREAPPVGLHWQSPYAPMHIDPFTPPLQVRGLSKRYGAGLQPSTPANTPTSGVSIIHGDMYEHEFEVQGVQLMHEPLMNGVEGDVCLKGLIFNHAHTYLAPRNPDQIHRQTEQPSSRRECTLKAGATSSPSSPRTLHAGCRATVSRSSAKTQQQKPTKMFGWDQTDQIPIVSAFYERGVNSQETLFSPTAEPLDTVSPEIWDYVGNV